MAAGSAAGLRVVVVGGGIAGLAAALRLEGSSDADVSARRARRRLGGKLRTEHVGPFVVEAAPDSFLSRKQRGVGLCEELGLGGELISRLPEHQRTFVRLGDALHPLPEGLTGMIPSNLDALEASELLSDEGMARFAAEPTFRPPPATRTNRSRRSSRAGSAARPTTLSSSRS